MYIPKWFVRAVIVVGIACVAWWVNDALDEGRSLLSERAAANVWPAAIEGGTRAGDADQGRDDPGLSETDALAAAVLAMSLQLESSGQQNPMTLTVLDGQGERATGGPSAGSMSGSMAGQAAAGYSASGAPGFALQNAAVTSGAGASSQVRQWFPAYRPTQTYVPQSNRGGRSRAGNSRQAGPALEPGRLSVADLIRVLAQHEIVTSSGEQQSNAGRATTSLEGGIGDLSLLSETAMTAIGQEIVIAADGSIVLVGDNGQLRANTGAASDGAIVALDAEGSLFSSRSAHSADDRQGGSARDRQTGPDKGNRRGSDRWMQAGDSPLTSPIESFGADRSVDIAGYEDHSLSVRGRRDVVTYDDSNVFIDRDGKVNSNTGDTDSAGLNAVDTTRSTVTAGPHCDDGCDDESIIQAEAGVFDEGDVAIDGKGNVVFGPGKKGGAAAEDDDSLPTDDGNDEDSQGDESDDGDVSDPAEPAETREQAGTGRTPTGKPSGHAMVIGGDGYDDLGVRVDGDDQVVTYDDSNVVIGGKGPVNAQVGDSDTGGTVTMGTTDSKVSGGKSR